MSRPTSRASRVTVAESVESHVPPLRHSHNVALSFVGQLKLLLWRNYLLKKRHFVSTLTEVFLPLAFIALLAWLQTIQGDTALEPTDYTCPMQSSVTPTLFVPQEEGADFFLEIETLGFGPGLQVVPPLLYLLMLSPKIQGQIALAPGNIKSPEDAAAKQKWLEDFQSDLSTMTAAVQGSGWKHLTTLMNTGTGLGIGFCSFDTISKMYESEAALDEYVSSAEYGNSDWGELDHHNCPLAPVERPRLHAAIIVNSLGDSFDYSIRTNVSVVPYTYSRVGFIDKLRKGVEEEYQNKYTMSGFATLQLAMDRYILGQKLPDKIIKTRKFEDYAVDQLCDSIMPIFKNIIPLLPPRFRPAVRLLNCVALFRVSRALGLDLTPLVEPASYVPNGLRFAQTPTKAYVDRPFYEKIRPVFALNLIITYLWPVSRLIRGIVHEKETKVKEAMSMMSLSPEPYVASWLCTYGAMFLFTSLSITTLSRFTILSTSDPSLVFMYFGLFGLDVVAFCFFVSVLFSRAKTASTAGVTMFFIFYLPYIGVANAQTASRALKESLMVFPPTAFGLGADVLATYEESGAGVTWQNMWYASTDTGVAFAAVLRALALNFFLYGALAWYLDAVVPTEHGTAKPWYFLCARRRGAAARVAPAEDEHDSPTSSSSSSSAVERVSGALDRLRRDGRCIVVDNLTKTFASKKTAVDSLSLTMYEGQIFVLLGHNGAGKTTTINMLTGMLAPTSGSASVYGRDLGTEMALIRSDLGVCPQHDVLWPELTVLEHLVFYATLKGTSNPVQTAHDMIATVELVEKTKTHASDLSGGMKRKLSIAIALIGDSKVVFLDEPTSGMDVHARRSTWRLLERCRAGRVIVLTTHFMDEADLLGDRIAIMAQGSLKCVGSSLFLKNRYGVGYTLTFAVADDEVDCDAVLEFVRRYAPNARIVSSVGKEFALQLPFESSHAFPALFDALDESASVLGTSEYGVSVTTLEEVFLSVASEDDDRERNNAIEDVSTPSPTASTASDVRTRPLKKTSKFSSHFRALVRKRFAFASRDSKSLVCNTCLPILFLILGLALLKAFPLPQPPPLALVDPVSMFGLSSADVVMWDADDVDFPTRIFASKLALSSNAAIAKAHYSLSALAMVDRDEDVVNNCTVDPTGKDIRDGVALKRFSRALNAGGRAAFGAFRFSPSSEGVVDVTIFANSTAKHSVPIYQSELSRALRRMYTGDESVDIVVNSAPFLFTSRFMELVDTFSAVSAAITVVIAFSFIPASVVVFAVKEREIGAKHLQMLSGTTSSAYWLSNLAFDFGSYLVPWLVSLGCVQAFSIDALVGDNFPALACLFLAYGFAVVPFTYMASFAFNSHSTAQNVLLLITFISGLVLMVASFVMSLIEKTYTINERLKYVYRVFPGFCLGDGLLSLTTNAALKTFGDGDLIKAENPFAWDVVGAELTYLIAEGFIYFGMCLWIDSVVSSPASSQRWRKYYESVWRCCGLRGDSSQRPTTAQLTTPLLEDEDVAAEEARINTGDVDDDALTVKHMRKVYPGGKVAVVDMSFGVPMGECFGFLGVNGAGKTTTLKMITGDVLPTHGTAIVEGYDVLTQQIKVRERIGYCPQFDALLDLLTVREHLQLFARLRRQKSVEEQCDDLLELLNLKPFENKLAGTLSGGNKRKLSVAIALVGKPHVIFLDEPSSGMDPLNRRYMWDVISVVSKQAKGAVVLTTHSMEEVEALCTRVGIVVAGRFKCLGSIQHLKNRFGNGLLLSFGVRPISQESAARFACYLSGVSTESPVEVTRVSYSCASGELNPCTIFSRSYHRRFAADADGRLISAVDDKSVADLPYESVVELCLKDGAHVIQVFTDEKLYTSQARAPSPVVARRIAEFRFYDCAPPQVESYVLEDMFGVPAPLIATEDTHEVECFDVADWLLTELGHTRLSSKVCDGWFSSARLMERHGLHSVFNVVDHPLSLGDVFRKVEASKVLLELADYSVTQTSLESIFVAFAAQDENLLLEV